MNGPITAPRALCLENSRIKVQVLPELGAKVWSIVHKPTDTEWIWQNPAVGLHAAPPGSNYDDHWSGGWEELFPNDAPGVFLGRDLPDHGEWWSKAWDWESLDGGGLRLWGEASSVPATFEKRLLLDGEEAALRVRYRITNRGGEPLFYLFKLHAAMAASERHELLLPGGKVLQVDPSFSTRMGHPGPAAWPLVPGKDGATVDLSRLPPKGQRHREFVYVTELPEGWCGLRDTATGTRFKLSYPKEVFPHVWLFMDLGGWRGYYTVVLEPCTNLPKDLETARKRGSCARLEPGQSLECEVRASFES